MSEYNVSVTLVTEVCSDCAAVWARVQNRGHLATCPYCAKREIEFYKKQRDHAENSARALRGAVTRLRWRRKESG